MDSAASVVIGLGEETPAGWFAVDYQCHLGAKSGGPARQVPPMSRVGRHVALPAPTKLLDPLGLCLAGRRSRRHFGSGVLSLNLLSTLLHAGVGRTGVFDDEAIAAAGFSARDHEAEALRGRSRFAYPSAGAVQAARAHVLSAKVDGLVQGVHAFSADDCSLRCVAALDAAQAFEALFGERDWIHDSAAVLVVSVSVVARGHYRHPYQLALIETGLIAQNVALAAEALGLAQCAVGDIDESVWFELCGTSHVDEVPFLAIAVGERA